jgi:hypothetical protein
VSLDFRRFDTKFYLSRKEVDSGLDFFYHSLPDT